MVLSFKQLSQDKIVSVEAKEWKKPLCDKAKFIIVFKLSDAVMISIQGDCVFWGYS